jgi:hypothetical protein
MAFAPPVPGRFADRLMAMLARQIRTLAKTLLTTTDDWHIFRPNETSNSQKQWRERKSALLLPACCPSHDLVVAWRSPASGARPRACLCGHRRGTSARTPARNFAQQDGSRKQDQPLQVQDALVVKRPIAPGANAESSAPLGYRRCRELFFCADGKESRLSSNPVGWSCRYRWQQPNSFDGETNRGSGRRILGKPFNMPPTCFSYGLGLERSSA